MKLIPAENPTQARKYFHIYLSLNDSLQTVRSRAKNQFALVRLKKHSCAQKVLLKFELIEDQLFLTYTDDGVGFNKNFEKKNGLKNTETRIFSCGGTLNFDATIERGSKILISFSLNSG